MKIDELGLKGSVFLAPMAGVNDLAFRLMCHKYGSSLNFTEMINVNAIERGNKATYAMAKTLDEEKPVAVQLFGTRISAIKKSIKMLENDIEGVNPDVFDFNFGCPVRKVMNLGAGAALLKRPSKIGEIISAMRDSTDLPISAKIRLGLTSNTANYLKTAQIIEKSGADMLIVHGRYQDQGYSGHAHWDMIKEIKESVNIPVVGNGDVIDGASARRMIDETGCDFVMVGRAAMGNPFVFRMISEYLKTGKNIEQKSKVELFEEYYVLAKKFSIKQSLIKEQAMYFSRGLPNSAKLRNSIRVQKDLDSVFETFKQ